MKEKEKKNVVIIIVFSFQQLKINDQLSVIIIKETGNYLLDKIFGKSNETKKVL